jgi:dihydroorotate dehydrogenase electron transfer subunit
LDDATMTPAEHPIAEMECAVVGHDWVNDSYRHLVADAPEPALAARPGQFFHILCPTDSADSPFLRRPMSVYRVDRAARRIAFLYKVAGAGTRTLSGLEIGDALNVFGPLGNGFSPGPGTRHAVIVARGVGLSTLAPLVEAALGDGLAATAILSARGAEYVMSEDYLRGVGARVMTVTDADGTSEVGRVEDMVRRLIAEHGADFIATCGSNRLLFMLQRVCAELGVAGQVAMEQRMGCGLGMCFCCVSPFRVGDAVVYRRICCDGPVFDLQEATAW